MALLQSFISKLLKKLQILLLVFSVAALILKGAESGRIQRRYLMHPNHFTYKDLHCRYSYADSINPENCKHGSYTDTCGREACYKGVGESCDVDWEPTNQYGRCIDGLECVCGKCFGCTNAKECALELENCRPNAIYRNRDEKNLISMDDGLYVLQK